jgi:hypothetical protein
MFNPATETPWGFLARNSLNLVAIVVPGGDEFVAGIYNSVQRLSIAVLGVIALTGLVQLVRGRAPRLAAVPLVATAIMVALNAAAGLTRRYPYGGAARHEFFLVPFVIVGFFSLIEAARRGLPRRLSRRRLTTVAAAVGVLASVASWTSTFRIQREALFLRQMNQFRTLVPSPQAVLLDQFSFINFFSHYHDWQWRVGGEWSGQAVAQVWSVAKADKRMAVCRETQQWSFDMKNVATYDSVVECGQRSGVGRVAMFRTHWWDTPPAIAVFDRRLAAENGLTATAFGTDGNDVSAEFEIDPAVLHDCSAPPPAPSELRVVSNHDRTVVLSWSPAGGARTSYVLEAGFTVGAIDVLNMPLGRTTTYTATRVNPATYYARVRAKNTCGVSRPSAEIRVIVE